MPISKTISAVIRIIGRDMKINILLRTDRIINILFTVNKIDTSATRYAGNNRRVMPPTLTCDTASI